MVLGAGKAAEVRDFGIRLQSPRGPADGRHLVQWGGAGQHPGQRELPVPRSARVIGRAEGVDRP